MSEHTRGPWEWDGKFTVGIPHVKGSTYFRTNPEDARLIAAAPDLLAACKLAALNFSRAAAGDQFLGDDDHEVWTALGKAIAKAEGA